MELFIRIKDGQPFEHPIHGDNFRSAFRGVDTNNLPPEFARFERVPMPIADVNKRIVSATSTYQWVDGIVKDVWEIIQEDIPPEELALLQGNIDDLTQGNTDELLQGNIDETTKTQQSE